MRSLQVLQALLGFTHFDVKTENILVVKREGGDFALVFTDFGRSGYGHQVLANFGRSENGHQVPVEASIATITYTPLDVALGCTSAFYTQAIDMHPIALVLLSLCLGRDIFLYMSENDFQIPETFSQYLQELWKKDQSREHLGDQLAEAFYRCMVLITNADDADFALPRRLDSILKKSCIENFFLNNHEAWVTYQEHVEQFSLRSGLKMTKVRDHSFIKAIGIESIICCLDPDQVMRLTPTEILELCQNIVPE